MSRAPHDSITRLLPGDDNADTRRKLRLRVRRAAEVIPEGYELRITSEGGKLYPIGTLVEVVKLSG
jgi:hypothetical protein